MNLGLRIKPVNGDAFDVWGIAYWKYINKNEDKCWYCAGQSFPENIVEKVYETNLTPEEIYQYALSQGRIV